MFEHRTEINGWLSVNPQSFSKVNNGQARIFEKSKYRYCTQNRRIGAGAVKQKQCHRNQTILQLRAGGITSYEAQKGILALAPQQKYDNIITKHFFFCAIARKMHYERLLLMLLARDGYCYPYGANVARCG